MGANIALPQCAENRITEGMGQNIGIRMASKTLFKRNHYSAKNQIPIGGKPMGIVAMTDTHGSSRQIFILHVGFMVSAWEEFRTQCTK